MESTLPAVTRISFEEFINETKRDAIIESFKSNGLVIVTDVPKL